MPPVNQKTPSDDQSAQKISSGGQTARDEGQTVLSAAEQTERFRKALWPEERPAPHRTVRCRHCGRKNRIEVPMAVLEPERHVCGSCNGPLFLSPEEPFVGLRSLAYEHSLDRRSLAALRSMPGVPGVMRWMMKNVGDRAARIMLMSEAIECSDDQFPGLLRLMDKARERLDMEVRPTIFLGESPHMNALTMGVEHPVIVVRSALLDQMSDDELVAVLGHELGHLHAEHPLYSNVSEVVLRGGVAASDAFRLFSWPLRRALLWWTRCAELTADRASLLTTRDLRVCISSMLILAAGNRPGTSGRTKLQLASFVRQCRELERAQATSWLDGGIGKFLDLDRTHPHAAWRVLQMLQWVDHGNYLNILSGEYPRRWPVEDRDVGVAKAQVTT